MCESSRNVWAHTWVSLSTFGSFWNEQISHFDTSTLKRANDQRRYDNNKEKKNETKHICDIIDIMFYSNIGIGSHSNRERVHWKNISLVWSFGKYVCVCVCVFGTGTACMCTDHVSLFSKFLLSHFENFSMGSFSKVHMSSKLCRQFGLIFYS